LHQDDSPAIRAEGRGGLTFKTRTVPAFGTRSGNENQALRAARSCGRSRALTRKSPTHPERTRPPARIKSKNPEAPAVRREAEEDWDADDANHGLRLRLSIRPLPFILGDPRSVRFGCICQQRGLHMPAPRPRGQRADLTFGDIARKLHVLLIECTRCQRKGRYSVAKLIAQYGRRGNMTKWMSDLRGDCPNRNHPQMHRRCDLICPDLPKVV